LIAFVAFTLTFPLIFTYMFDNFIIPQRFYVCEDEFVYGIAPYLRRSDDRSACQ
jgi:hypothetical protein